MKETRIRRPGNRHPEADQGGLLEMEGQRPRGIPLPALWSVRALSSHWRISRQQIYDAHQSGRLRGFRILGTLRFLEADLLAYLAREGVSVKGE